MKTNEFVFVCAAIVPFLAGCASAQTSLSPIGPNPSSRVASASEAGHLQVFSATEKSPPFASDDIFDQTFPINLHTGYEITDAAGHRFKFVPNHASDLDEWPDDVRLPAGVYEIKAKSSWCGHVTIPVVIQNGKTTIIHLDNNWWPPSSAVANQLVYLPDGEAAGWSSSISKSSE